MWSSETALDSITAMAAASCPYTSRSPPRQLARWNACSVACSAFADGAAVDVELVFFAEFQDDVLLVHG